MFNVGLIVYIWFFSCFLKMERDSGSNATTVIQGPECGTNLRVEADPQNPQTQAEARNVSADTEKQPVPEKKKRKVSESRAKCWEHFIKTTNEAGGKMAKCKYCGKSLCADPKLNGTSSLRSHVLKCMKMPHPKDTRQSLLTLTPASAVDDSQSDQLGMLGTWNFDQEFIRKALARMLIVDELPFKFVEGEGFKNFMVSCCPMFKIPSRWTLSRDCYSIYLDERVKLKSLLHTQSHRISITTDSWTSLQRINYMCVTAHFIDTEWKLQKRIISFVPVTSHRGEYIAKALENCLLDWGLKSVLCVTVDNASSNDAALTYFKKKLLSWGTSSHFMLKFLHMRCLAHILNLIVNDGMKEAAKSVKKIREVVRYIKNSPLRIRKFNEIADFVGIDSQSGLSLDVPTRWNSTYIMLETACLYERAFDKYEEQESSFRVDLKDEVPDYNDWQYAKKMVNILKNFYEITLRISGSLYLTANSFFNEISDLNCMLNEWQKSTDITVVSMGHSMKLKFEKYWGDPEKINTLIFLANILDPRDKLEYMEFSLKEMYGDDTGSMLYTIVKSDLNLMFDEYMKLNCSASAVSASAASAVSVPNFGKSMSLLKAKFRQQKMDSGGSFGFKKNELEIYLSEDIIMDEGDSFDVLRWWKHNSERFPVLSLMARDVLAVPISTVASESAFSTGGRVLDSFRSSLSPKIVEALICTSDWLRMANKPICLEETVDDMERFEKGNMKLRFFFILI